MALLRRPYMAMAMAIRHLARRQALVAPTARSDHRDIR
jgi:hypothetical protein